MAKTVVKKGSSAGQKEVRQPLKIIPVFLLVAYGFITVLTPNMNTLDSNGPKFMTLAFLNLVTFAWLFSRKELKTSPELYQGFFSNAIGVAYTLVMVFSLLSFLNAFNMTEALLHYAKLFTTFSATYLIAVLILTEKQGIRYLAIAMTSLLIFDSITVYSEIGKFIDGRIPSIVNIKSVYSNKNILAASIFVKIPFALWLMFTKSSLEKTLGGITSFMAMIAIFFMSSRAFYLGLILLTLALGFYFIRKFLQDRQTTHVRIFATYFGMLITSFLIYSFIQSNVYPKKNDGLAVSVATRMSTITEDSGGGRYDGWIRSWHVFKEHPVLGVGVGNWKIATLKEENYSKTDYTYQYKAHNDFIETAAEAGIFAGVFFLLIFVLTGGKFLQLLIKKGPPAALNIFLLPTLGLLCYTMDALFNFPQDRPEIQALFALYAGMAIALTIRNLPRSREHTADADITEALHLELPFLRKKMEFLSGQGSKEGFLSQALSRGLSGIFLVILLISAWFMVMNFKSLKLQRIIKQEINAGKLTSPADKFLKGFPFLPNLNVVGEPIAAQKARYLISEKRYNEAISILKNDQSSPFDTRPEYFLAMAYFEKKMPDSAIYYSRKVYEMKPLHFKNISILTNTMIQQGQVKEAESIMDGYLAKNIRDREAVLFASSMYDKTGSLDKAVSIIDSARAWFPADTSLVKQSTYIHRRQVLAANKPTVDAALAAFNAKKYPEAVTLLNKLLSVYPSYTEAREYRAFSYFFLKEYARSIEDLSALIASGNRRSNLFNLLGVNYYNLQKQDEACVNFKIARDLGDKDGTANYTRFCLPAK